MRKYVKTQGLYAEYSLVELLHCEARVALGALFVQLDCLTDAPGAEDMPAQATRTPHDSTYKQRHIECKATLFAGVKQQTSMALRCTLACQVAGTHRGCHVLSACKLFIVHYSNPCYSAVSHFPYLE